MFRHAHAKFLFHKVRHLFDLGTIDDDDVTRSSNTGHEELDEGSIMGMLDYDSPRKTFGAVVLEQN